MRRPRYGARRLGLALVLLFAALYWAQPTGAFEAAILGTRDVSAQVVAQASAYDAITGGACSVASVGGSCSFTVTNRATTPQTFRVSEQFDNASKTFNYRLDGGSSVGSGTVTSAEIAVGGATTLTATVNACVCAGQTFEVLWLVQGAKAGVLDMTYNEFRMTITYT